MDRNRFPRSRPLIVLIGLAIAATGCSRMKTYRAQNSPLPLPRLGLLGKARPGRDSESARPDVAWSGDPRLDLSPAPAQETKAVASTTPTPDLSEIRALVKAGREQFAGMSSYQVSIHRQERAGGTLQPAEDVLLSIRHRPRAVRLEWPDGPHKGREVLYSVQETAGMMRIHMPDSLIPVPDLSMAPDSPMVLAHSRHPITEAGMDAVLERLEAAVSSQVSAVGSIADGGIVTPDEVGIPCRKVVRTTPKGEVWTVFLDAKTGIPRMIHEASAAGELLEHDVFRDLKPNVPTLAEAAAFDPASRWGQGRGLFSRVAGGASPSSVPDSARR